MTAPTDQALRNLICGHVHAIAHKGLLDQLFASLVLAGQGRYWRLVPADHPDVMARLSGPCDCCRLAVCGACNEPFSTRQCVCTTWCGFADCGFRTALGSKPVAS